MKSVQGKLSTLGAAAVAIALTTVAVANGDDTPGSPGQTEPIPGSGSGSTSSYPDPWFWPDLHDHNRAIAFGSLILSAGGSNMNNWKEVRPYGYCMKLSGELVIRNPDKKSGANGGATSFDDGSGSSGSGNDDDDPTDPTDPTDPMPSCGWSVMVTTAYRFVECPNGRAYIARSGEGVAIENRHEGEIFGWSEAVACGEDPFPFDGKGNDVNRPLDLQNLTIQRR